MKNKIPALIFIVGTIAVVVSFYINSRLPTEKRLEADQLGAIYTGLGYAGLAATFWHDRQRAKELATEHSRLIAKMQDQSDASYYSSYTSALIAKRDYCKYEWQILQTPHGSEVLLERSRKYGAEVDRLEKEIDRVLEVSKKI